MTDYCPATDSTASYYAARDLINVPISEVALYLAQGWHMAERGGVPAYQDTHHGRHGVLLWRPADEEREIGEGKDG